MSTHSLQLSVIDQSPVIAGHSAADAINDSMQLIQALDELGYHRYWFAEHHGSASFASASPTLMMANAAARTQRIRLGSGGILLGNTSALQIAEQLRLLSCLAPGRIDGGLGRAPGGDARILNAIGRPSRDGFEVLADVLGYLSDTRHPAQLGKASAVPDTSSLESAPEMWMLGTSPQSAVVAGRLGLRYAYGAFIDPRSAVEALTLYHQEFTPSIWCQTPHTMYVGVAFCGETHEEAVAISATSEKWFAQSFLRNENVRFPLRDTPLEMNELERLHVGFRRESVLIGDAPSVVQGLKQWQKQYAVNEIGIVTITDSYESRLASYARIMSHMR